MKIIQLPSTTLYPRRLSVQKWTIISITLQVVLLCFLLVHDWILSSNQSNQAQGTSHMNKFLVYFPLVMIFQLFIFKFIKAYLFGLIFYLIWITAQSFTLFNEVVPLEIFTGLLLLLFSIIVLATITVVYHKNKILINKTKDKK